MSCSNIWCPYCKEGEYCQRAFEEMEEEQSSNIENLEQNDLTTVASLAKKQKK